MSANDNDIAAVVRRVLGDDETPPDIMAVGPLLDLLEERKDPRWLPLWRMLGDIHDAIHQGASFPWSVLWSPFRSLFWAELGGGVVEALKMLQKREADDRAQKTKGEKAEPRVVSDEIRRRLEEAADRARREARDRAGRPLPFTPVPRYEVGDRVYSGPGIPPDGHDISDVEG